MIPDLLPTSAVDALSALFTRGHARIPESWGLDGPARAGLWWRAATGEVVATPALLRLAAPLSSDGERVGLLLATHSEIREHWLELEAARLADLGQRGDVAGLCQVISSLGGAANAVRSRLSSAKLAPTPYVPLELAVFGAPADQPAAAPGLLRVLSLTAPLREENQGSPATILEPVDPRNPEANWVAGRLIQGPGPAAGGGSVLTGVVPPFQDSRMTWVLETPWLTLLAVLVFTAEAWAAERQGGLQLELAPQHIQHFARPPAVQVVVTLSDGREVLSGTLGELVIRSLDALGMALVPDLSVDALNQRLSSVISELLRAGVWVWKPEARSRYEIGESFGFDCYRGMGHRFIFLGAERLSQTLRSVAVAWARSRAERTKEGAT